LSGEWQLLNGKKLKNLFKGLKFFLNREIPREPFVFAVKAFSGEVSWDKITGLGSTFQENDPTITHQIVDRPVAGQMYINRVYVQPQWVFDCINENMILPVDDYLPGAILPPHLSPFVEIKEGDYVPPEKQRLIKMKLGIQDNEDKSAKYINPNEHKHAMSNDDDEGSKNKTTKANNKKQQAAATPAKKDNKSQKKGAAAAKKEEEPLDDDDEDENNNGDDDDEEEEDDDHGMKVDIDSPDENDDDETEEETFSEDDEKEVKKLAKSKKPLIGVSRGQVEVENLAQKLKKQMDEEKKLTEMTIPKKNKRLYNKIMHSRKKTRQENEKLKEKRDIYETNMAKKIQTKKR